MQKKNQEKTFYQMAENSGKKKLPARIKYKYVYLVYKFKTCDNFASFGKFNHSKNNECWNLNT